MAQMLSDTGGCAAGAGDGVEVAAGGGGGGADDMVPSRKPVVKWPLCSWAGASSEVKLPPRSSRRRSGPRPPAAAAAAAAGTAARTPPPAA